MKLIDYARLQGISYRTAWRWYKAGMLDAYQTPTGTIVVRKEENLTPTTGRIASQHGHRLRFPKLRPDDEINGDQSAREKPGRKRSLGSLGNPAMDEMGKRKRQLQKNTMVAGSFNYTWCFSERDSHQQHCRNERERQGPHNL